MGLAGHCLHELYAVKQSHRHTCVMLIAARCGVTDGTVRRLRELGVHTFIRQSLRRNHRNACFCDTALELLCLLHEVQTGTLPASEKPRSCIVRVADHNIASGWVQILRPRGE